MTPLDRLVAIEEIKRLRARWSKLVDELRWQELSCVLATDAELDLSATSAFAEPGVTLPPVCGAQAICDFLEQHCGPHTLQVHVATMPEIDIDSETTAHGHWRQESYIYSRAGRNGKVGIGYGTIEDSYRKIDGRWLFQSMRIRVDQVI